MANATRTGKSSYNWTPNELIAYNITVSPFLPSKFFPPQSKSGPDSDPLAHIDPSILASHPGFEANNNPTVSHEAASYLSHLHLASTITSLQQESYIVQFAAKTLDLVGYYREAPHIMLLDRYTFPLEICVKKDNDSGGGTGRDGCKVKVKLGARKEGADHKDDSPCPNHQHIAYTDVSLIYHCLPTTFVLLFLIKDELYTDRNNGEAEVIASAIAAFQHNNANRLRLSLPALDCMTFPCITMDITVLTFYLVPVTKELSAAVASGQYPTTPTRVERCTIAPRHAGIGMDDVEYRKEALRALGFFREMARSHWGKVMEGVL